MEKRERGKEVVAQASMLSFSFCLPLASSNSTIIRWIENGQVTGDNRSMSAIKGVNLFRRFKYNQRVVTAMEFGRGAHWQLAQMNNGKRLIHTGPWNLAEYETASTPNPQLHSNQNRMEKTVNNVTLLGRVGGDPQKRGTQEHPVVVFSLATHSNYNYQSGGILQKTDWHRICVFKPYLRDTVYKYLNKGQRVYITGRISYGEIKDENGNPHTTTSIIADDVIFVSHTGAKPSEAEVD